MNKRIEELARDAGLFIEHDVVFGNHSYEGKLGMHGDEMEKFVEVIVRELVSKLTVEGSEFYHNEFNNWGSITVVYFVGGDPHRMRGEEEQAKFWGGEVRGTGFYHLNEKFVQHLMKQHFGVEE